MTPIDTLHSRFAGLGERYPAPLFFGLTIAISWTIWLPTLSVLPEGNVRLVAIVPGAFGPMIAAAAVTALRGESVRQWLCDSLAGWRSIRWHAVAVAVPVVVSLALLAVLVAITGDIDATNGPGAAALFGFNLVFATLLGGGQEEFGWRGFALPHLQARYDALTASLLIGVVWAIWHAPMFVFGVYSENPALYAVGVLAYAIVFTWYYNSSGGNLLGAVLMHGALNASVSVPPLLVDDVDALPFPYEGLLASGFWLVALALLGRYGRTTLSSESALRPSWTDTSDNARTPVSSLSTSGTDD